MELHLKGFSIVANHTHRGIEVMALSDRPEIELNEFQVEKTGFDLDVRYQQILVLIGSIPLPMLQDIVSRANTILSNNQGS